MKPFKLKSRQRYPHKITYVDGIKFHSQDEARRYKELLLIAKSDPKRVQNLILQPRFLLHPSFIQQGDKYQKSEYIADFMYSDEKGRTIVEDVKSSHTKNDKAYRLKMKLMLFINAGIHFKEIIYS